MFSAQRVESLFGAQMESVALRIVEKRCGAIRACSQPGDTHSGTLPDDSRQ
jgi:hypothetical protein